MIRYALACHDAHAFESWFPSSDAYDAQTARGLVTCPICGSAKVAKQLMAPAIARKDRPTPGLAVDAPAAGSLAAGSPAGGSLAAGGPAAGGPAVSGPGAGPPDGTAPGPNGSEAGSPGAGGAEPDAAQAMALFSERGRELRAMVKAFREHVTRNADYVGESFTAQARKMHEGEIEHRSIYGEATLADAKALLEEGIEIHPLPMVPGDRN